MRRESIVITCDICRDPIQNNARALPEPTKLQVIFTTEQTEGRSTKPYLSDQSVDLCTLCHQHILNGHYVFGSGAQGHNTFTFKEPR